MNKVSLLLLMTIILSCGKENSVKVEKDVLFHRYVTDSDIETKNVTTKFFLQHDTSMFYFFDNKDTLGISYYFLNDNDSILNIHGEKCPLVFFDSITIEDKSFAVRKYYLDIEYIIDEEMSFFISENYGLILAYSDAWSRISYSIEYDSISKQLTDSIIKNRYKYFISTSAYIQNELNRLPPVKY
jgi:hypothetical protein